MRGLALAVTCTGGLLLAGTNPRVEGDHCSASAADRASADLYCIELVAAPGVPAGVRGHVVLDFVPGPFTISVTAEGHQTYRPRLVLHGLPSPQAIDSHATAYVAWVTTPLYSPFVRLGVVQNGVVTLPTVSFDQFVIVISAERSGDVVERAGRLVLRGGSPSTRMQPPDIQQFAVGVMGSQREHAHGAAGDTTGVPTGAARWTSVPMPPGIGMLPSEMALRPPVAALLPAGEPNLPHSRPPRVVRLAANDTLVLTAGRVRRTIHGREHVMYAFNGQSPGPLLWVDRGAEVTVQFVNGLDQPSTIHWHGVRLDWRMDGVPHVSQLPVPPGGSFTYRLRFPDAGLYWYHPHVREDMQQDLGLAGNIMVRGLAGLPAVAREEILMMDDLLVGADGLVPYGVNAATHALMGRFGNVFMVNGEPVWRARARAGETVRVWFTNAANARTFNLSIANASMRLVAGDLGVFDHALPIESIVLAPAERYAVDVTFNGGDAVLLNRVRALDHFYGRFVQQDDTLGMIRVAGARVRPTRGGRAGTVPTAMPDVAADGEPDFTLAFGLRTRDLPFVTSRLMLLDSTYFHPIEWSGTMVGMNWATTTAQARWFVRDVATGRENEAIGIRVRQGDRKRLRLVNQRNTLHGMHHPIHLHGQRFLVVSVNGVAPAARAWKDTILLPAGAVADILVEFDNPGRWMLHCHIAEHVESGMMTTFEVETR